MADVVTHLKTGQQILNGGAVVSANMLGRHEYIGPTGIHNAPATGVYSYLEIKYSGRFDDPTYYG